MPLRLAIQDARDRRPTVMIDDCKMCHRLPQQGDKLGRAVRFGGRNGCSSFGQSGLDLCEAFRPETWERAELGGSQPLQNVERRLDAAGIKRGQGARR